MTAAELRIKAAEIIEQRGWCQNTIESSDGSVCMVGAMRTAACGRASDWSAWDTPEYKEAREQLREEIGIHGTLTGWNDCSGRTQVEVLARLRAGLPLADETKGQVK